MRLLHNLLRDPKHKFQCRLTSCNKVTPALNTALRGARNTHVLACCKVRAKETAQSKHALMTCSAVQVVHSAFCAPAPCLLTARDSCAEVSYEL